MKPRADCYRGSQDGVVMIEFLIILPLLLCLAGATIEIARFLRFNQMASVLSQEAALRAYRQCSDFFVYGDDDDFGADATRARTGRCLSEVGGQMVGSRNTLQATTTSISFNIAISVYRFDGEDAKEGFPRNSARISWTSDATFPGTERAGDNAFWPSLENRKRIVVAEVSYNYEPVIRLYQGFWQGLAAAFRRQGNVFIETTII